MLNQSSLKSKQELALLQNQLLLLFLKYKLSFRCSEEAITEAPEFWKDKRNLLAHCFLHAVFGNSTTKDPQVIVELKKTENKNTIEIRSTGNAETFHRALVEYCDDQLLKEYLNLENLEKDYLQLNPEFIEVEHDYCSSGSRIRLHLA